MVLHNLVKTEQNRWDVVTYQQGVPRSIDYSALGSFGHAVLSFSAALCTEEEVFLPKLNFSFVRAASPPPPPRFIKWILSGPHSGRRRRRRLSSPPPFHLSTSTPSFIQGGNRAGEHRQLEAPCTRAIVLRQPLALLALCLSVAPSCAFSYCEYHPARSDSVPSASP